MSLRTSTVAAIRRRLPELDDEAAWRGALAGAASLFMLLVAIAVLVPLRDRLDTGSLALVLLLPPLIATNGGRTLSLILALISALTFNFLFTQPYYSFRIESSASIAAFLIYTLIAVVLANYVGGFRSASAAAKRRARSMELLQSLAIDLIRCDDLRPALRRTLSDFKGALGLRGAALRVTLRDQELDERVGSDAAATRTARAGHEPVRTAPSSSRCAATAACSRCRSATAASASASSPSTPGTGGPRARRSRCWSRSAASSASRSGASASSTRA